MSLKDALLKAGLKSSKHENVREKKRGAPVKKIEKHQAERNFCEVCECIQPDVERYRHRNPTVDAEWICVACADKNMIDDQFRTTKQSNFSKAGSFKRYYGATKVFDDRKVVDPRKKNVNTRVDGNKSSPRRSTRPKNANRGNGDGNFNK